MISVVNPADAGLVSRVAALAWENFPRRFQGLPGISPLWIEKKRSAWSAELDRLLRLGRGVALLGKRGVKEGYAVLEKGQVEPSSGEIQGGILDISLEPGIWQCGLAAALLERAEALCREGGLQYLVIHLPFGFQEEILPAQGFRPERRHIVRFLRDFF